MADVVRLLSPQRLDHTMRVFKTRDLALSAASAMIDEQGDREIEVGPMLAAREGNVFKGEEIRRISDAGST